jgi:hypothetical protein
MYRDFIADQEKRIALPNRDLLAKAFDDRTLFAWQIDSAWIMVGLRQVRQQFLSSVQGGGATGVDVAQMNERLDDLEKALKDIGPFELGILVSSELDTSTPTVSLFFGNFDRSAGEELKVLGRVLSDTIAKWSGGSQAVKVEIKELPQVGSELVITGPGGFRVGGKPVSEHSLLLTTGGTMIGQVSRMLRSGTPLVKLPIEDGERVLARSSNLILINLKGILDLTKPMLPLLTLQLPPSSGVTPQSIDELVSLLEVKLMTLKTLAKEPSGYYCTTSDTFFLSK